MSKDRTSEELSTRTKSVPEAVPPFEPGDVLLARYAVELPIGEGGQGWVFSALDLEATPPHRVALKVLKTSGEEDLLRFEHRELELLRRVHETRYVPNVVRCLQPELKYHRGVPFLVLEFVAGPSLRDILIKHHAVPLADVVRIGVGLARGLAAIHAVVGVHRDLKPSNVRLRGGVEPVILDLGAVKLPSDGQDITCENRVPLTPLYAAPEQFVKGEVDAAADVYALGAILHELLGSALASDNQWPGIFRARRLLGRVLDPCLDKQIEALAYRCCARDPRQRPRAAEVARLLEQTADLPRARRRWPTIGVASLALAVAGKALFDHAPSSSPDARRREGMDLRGVTTLISGQGGLRWIAVSGSSVFWTTFQAQGAVMRVPVEGGTPATLVSDRVYPVGIAADDRGVYWGDNEGLNSLFLRDDRPASLVAGQNGIGSLRVANGYIYWTSTLSGIVGKVPVLGGDPVFLATSQLSPVGLAVDAGNAYWADSWRGTIMKVSLQGGPVTTLALGQNTPTDIAVDEAFVYWVRRDDGKIMKMPTLGGEASVAVADNGEITCLALHESYIYWGNSTNGTLMKVPKHGGPALVVASEQWGITAVIVDDAFVYWVAEEEGAIRRVAWGKTVQ